MHSSAFITSREMTGVFAEMRSQNGGQRLGELTLQRKIGRAPWQSLVTGTQTEVREFVRGLDGSPMPGMFRLTTEV